jgi:multiple sugar transport system permease protein
VIDVAKWFDKNIRYIFTLPAIIFMLLMICFPIIYTVGVSLTNWNLSNPAKISFIGIRNYLYLFSNLRFWLATWRTLYFSIVAVIVETILGVGIACFLNREFKGVNLVKTLFMLPMIVTPVAIAFVWMLIYQPTIGFANYILVVLHMPPQLWLSSQATALNSLMVIDVWEWTPFIMLIVLAGLTTLPKEPFESAAVDGANAWTVFTKITLPMVMPTIIVAILIRLIDCLKTFDIIYSTTLGGPGTASETLNIYSYVLGFQYLDMGKGSALVLIFLIIVAIISVLMMTVRRKVGVEQ